jgi:hypothetical protein
MDNCAQFRSMVKVIRYHEAARGKVGISREPEDSPTTRNRIGQRSGLVRPCEKLLIPHIQNPRR